MRRDKDESLAQIAFVILDQTSGSLKPGGLVPVFLSPAYFPGAIQSPLHKEV